MNKPLHIKANHHLHHRHNPQLPPVHCASVSFVLRWSAATACPAWRAANSAATLTRPFTRTCHSTHHFAALRLHAAICVYNRLKVHEVSWQYMIWLIEHQQLNAAAALALYCKHQLQDTCVVPAMHVPAQGKMAHFRTTQDACCCEAHCTVHTSK